MTDKLLLHSIQLITCRLVRFNLQQNLQCTRQCTLFAFQPPKMTGGNVINRPKTALQKNLNKLTRVKKAQKKKQQQQNKRVKQGISVSAKKKRLIMKHIKKQQREANAMEVVPEKTSKKTEKKANRGNTAEKMDTS